MRRYHEPRATAGPRLGRESTVYGAEGIVHGAATVGEAESAAKAKRGLKSVPDPGLAKMGLEVLYEVPSIEARPHFAIGHIHADMLCLLEALLHEVIGLEANSTGGCGLYVFFHV